MNVANTLVIPKCDLRKPKFGVHIGGFQFAITKVVLWAGLGTAVSWIRGAACVAIGVAV